MKIAVVTLGGTIASVPGSDGDASPRLSADELVADAPNIDDVAEIDTYQFSNVPSTHLEIADLYDLLRFITELDGDYNGIVVTQGTDILEETSYFIDLCYDGSIPVIFTGAMRTPTSAGADGPANLLASVRTASDPDASGVLVLFNDRIYDPKTVTKMHSMNADSFRSPEFGPVGAVDEDRVVWKRTADRSEPVFDPNADELTTDVAMITAGTDVPAEHIRFATDCDAICLATTGAGHISPGMILAFAEIREAGIPIVATTRCPEGRLARNTYGFRGSERTLQELGCYYSDVNLQKTRIRTIVALASNRLDDAFDR